MVRDYNYLISMSQSVNSARIYLVLMVNHAFPDYPLCYQMKLIKCFKSAKLFYSLFKRSIKYKRLIKFILIKYSMIASSELSQKKMKEMLMEVDGWEKFKRFTHEFSQNIAHFIISIAFS